MDKKTLIKVINRSDGIVFYEIQDLGIQRHYEANEVKEVTFEELLKLSYAPGGLTLIKNYLRIDNAEAVKEILGDVEPEYYYTEKDVKTLLINGTLAQLEDCLDFADEGVIDLVKNLAVKLEINDVAKRNAILTKTGFNVDRAIRIVHESRYKDETAETPSKRRAAPITASAAEDKPARRTDPPKYNIVSML